MSWADNKVQPGQFLTEIKKLIESGEISEEYTPETIALFCCLYNSGFLFSSRAINIMETKTVNFKISL